MQTLYGSLFHMQQHPVAHVDHCQLMLLILVLCVHGRDTLYSHMISCQVSSDSPPPLQLSYLNLGGNALLVHQHQGLRCWWEHPHPPAGNDTRF